MAFNFISVGQGPKYVKIFINLPRSMDFEEAERSGQLKLWNNRG